MSGGSLVVLDRAGREVKRYALASGLATLGSDPACDIRIMLPAVSPHHATVVVHANQTVVRNVCAGDTQVNGAVVSVAALQHGDIISIAGRSLRWDYDNPKHSHQPAQPALAVVRVSRGSSRRGAAAAALRRGSGAAAARPRERALQLAIEMSHRASMPGSTGGKQVAVVQPQRRDNTEQNDKSIRSPRDNAPKRSRGTRSELEADDKARRPRVSIPASLNPTKATLWIESRKTSPRKSTKSPKPQTPKQKSPRLQSLRVQTLKAQTPKNVVQLRRNTMSAKKSTPLRLTVLKRAQSAHKMKVTKIEAPLTIDHTKQAALLLMAGGARRAEPSLVVRRNTLHTLHTVHTAQRNRSSRSTAGNTRNSSVTIFEITDSDSRNTTRRSNASNRSSKSPVKSPLLPSPRKSALKDPTAKKNVRKTESIKFDLSNLEGHSQMDNTQLDNETTDDDITLHYSTTSSTKSPSPRRSIHSRSSRILETSLGTTLTMSPPAKTSVQESPRQRKSSRSSFLIQKALDQSLSPTKSEISQNGTVTLSPRSRPRSGDMESYSIVDLVSINSDGRPSTSVYNSAASESTAFGTPQDNVRRTRSTIDPSLLTSSTPYLRKSKKLSRSRSNDISKVSTKSASKRRSKSMTTPETDKSFVFNSTRISRASRSRSRINDSDLLLIEDDDDSPKSSRRVSNASKSKISNTLQTTRSTQQSILESPLQGTITPENRHSPEEATTPVLSIQSLLNSSQSSLASQQSNKKGRKSTINTIGGVTKAKTRIGAKSKSLPFSARKTRLRLSSDSVEILVNEKSDKAVTPKSAVKLVPEGVKNKHSTAKKPLSKRSIIDDLNESQIVKQLFNSPVKRKLSQSMTEFSRKHLFDDEEIQAARRPTRNTIAFNIRTPDNSFVDHTESYTPEMFVSPISTPTKSPDFRGIKLLFNKNTPENDLRNVRGVKALLRTPRARQSIHNDLTDVRGVKSVFANSPKNRLSDVRVKEVFAASPKNDLRRVSGVKSLFQANKSRKSPRNDLSDVRGVKKLFKRKSPENDLRNVSGVKRTLRGSPKNDLRDVRGVKRVFQEKENNELSDMSGVEELFNVSTSSKKDASSLFDQLLGKPPVKAVYSKTFSRTSKKSKKTNPKSLHISLDVISNVEGWLEKELQKRLNKSKSRELQKLATDTVEGNDPIRTSRVRNSTLNDNSRQKSASELYSAHTLPIKKRSLVNDKGRLPIKKRAVVHSTPVKGKVNVTMNASELGRVSPIAAVDKTSIVENDTVISSNKQAESNRKSRRVTKTNQKIMIEFEIPPLSPKRQISPRNKSKTSPRAPTPKAPTPKAPTPKAPTPKAPTPKASTSKVPTPKAPTPKATTRKQANSPKAATTKRATRGKPSPKNKQATPKVSPKRTRTRTVTKQTSSNKISITITNDNNTTKRSSVSPKKSKKVVSTKAKNTRATKPKASPKKNTASSKKVSGKEISKDVTTSPKARSTRAGKKPPTPKAKPSPKAKASPKKKPTRATKQNSKDTTVENNTTSSRSCKAKTPTKEIKPRQTRGAKSKPISPKNVKTPSPNKSRGRKTAESKKKAPTLVIAKKTPVMTPVKVTRKRKEPETTMLTPVAKKTRGNKQVVEKSPKIAKTRNVKKAVAPKSAVKTQTKRGKRNADNSEVIQKVESPKKSRAKKTVENSITETKKRGRKTVVVETTLEKPKRGRKADVSKETATKTKKDVKSPVTKVSKTRKAGISQENVSETSKTRGKSTKVEAKESKSRKRKSTGSHDEVPAKLQRGRPKAEPNTQKGRKAKPEAPAEPKGKQKRKAPVEPTPVIVESKKPRGKKTTDASPNKVTRVTRRTDTEANKTAGRSRRR